MPFFGTSTIVHVGSTVYNLAGEEKDRPNFLKTVVVGAVIGNAPSVAESITQAYRTGPGARLKGFARWAESSGYSDAVGLVTGTISAKRPVDATQVKPHLPVAAGTTAMVTTVRIGRADYRYWAEQKLAQVAPDQIDTAWTAEITADGGSITIRLVSGSTISFAPAGFDPNAQYVYAVYREVQPPSVGPVVAGAVIDYGATAGFIPTDGWTFDSRTDPSHAVTLRTQYHVHKVYDGGPVYDDYAESYRDDTIHDHRTVHTKLTRGPAIGDSVVTRKSWLYQLTLGWVDEVVSTESWYDPSDGGVSVTRTVTDQVIRYGHQEEIDTQDTVVKAWGTPKVFLYQQGSGNPALDALWAAPLAKGRFFPFVPIRVDNRFVSERWPDSLYPRTKAAFRRSVGTKMEKVQSGIAASESLGDLDFAYLSYGVSLNTKDNAGKRYIYQFFKMAMEDNILTDPLGYGQFKVKWTAAQQSWEDWLDWRRGYVLDLPEPVILPYPEVPQTLLAVTSNNFTGMSYDMTLVWNFVYEETGPGRLKPDAKPGDCWFTVGATDSFPMIQYAYDATVGDVVRVTWDTGTATSVVLNWQIDDTRWRRLTIQGLSHWNRVYRGETVTISAETALADPKDSGFIVPLHVNVFKALGVKDQAQLGSCCFSLVFNTYVAKKTKWWQAGWFKVLLIIAIVVISILFPPAATSVGLLGTNAAVGATLGFAAGTVAATVAGAIANAIAAMVVTTIISRGAQALLGDKLGAIVGAIASMVALQVGTAVANGVELSAQFGNLMNAENLLKLTSTVGNGVAGYVQGQAEETLGKIAGMQADHQAQAKAVQDLYAEILGGDHGTINPLGFTELAQTDTPLVDSIRETAETFLQRTLMTGADISDMTLSMLGGFTDITLSTDLPIT